MKRLKIVILSILLTCSSSIFAQEKKIEKTNDIREKAMIQTIDDSMYKLFDNYSGPYVYIFQSTCHIHRPNPPENILPVIDNLILSKTELTLTCSSQTQIQNSSPAPNLSVDIVTEASDPENDVLVYNYAVSGGRIIGSGSKVVWDLSGVKANEYTITAMADDGCGFCGKTLTKTVTVKDCSELKSESKENSSDKSASKFDQTGIDPPSVSDVKLSRQEIIRECPNSDMPCLSKAIIEVKTIAQDSGNEGIKYIYAVSGGKVIGEGPFVKWDLSDVKPGNYTITVSVDNGLRFAGKLITGKTVTKSITIKEQTNVRGN